MLAFEGEHANPTVDLQSGDHRSDQVAGNTRPTSLSANGLTLVELPFRPDRATMATA